MYIFYYFIIFVIFSFRTISLSILTCKVRVNVSAIVSISHRPSNTVVWLIARSVADTVTSAGQPCLQIFLFRHYLVENSLLTNVERTDICSDFTFQLVRTE